MKSDFVCTCCGLFIEDSKENYHTQYEFIQCPYCLTFESRERLIKNRNDVTEWNSTESDLKYVPEEWYGIIKDNSGPGMQFKLGAELKGDVAGTLISFRKVPLKSEMTEEMLQIIRDRKNEIDSSTKS